MSGSIKVRSKVIDLREINTGDAHIATLLKAGEYSLQKVDGKWSIKGYLAKPLESQPFYLKRFPLTTPTKLG